MAIDTAPAEQALPFLSTWIADSSIPHQPAMCLVLWFRVVRSAGVNGPIGLAALVFRRRDHVFGREAGPLGPSSAVKSVTIGVSVVSLLVSRLR
jgi:hypothetical protein